VTRPLAGSEPWGIVTPAVLAAIVCSVAIAACGGSAGKPPSTSASKPSSSSKSASRSPAVAFGLAFSKCMRSHGVPSFPDPNSPGGGFHVFSSGGAINFSGSALNSQAPAFQHAQTTCQHVVAPNGIVGTPPPSDEQVNQALALTKCMRTHGVPSFPDPTTSPPADPGRSELDLVDDMYFWLRNFTISDLSSPAFKHAVSKCRYPKSNPG